MSDNPKKPEAPAPRPNPAPAASSPPPAPRRSAAEQAEQQRVAQGGESREVEQYMLRKVTVTVKPGQTLSDAVKDMEVAEGGFEGTGLPPDPSGAIHEQEIQEGVDLSHPAIDDQPRRGVPASAVQRDMNDPTFETVPAPVEPSR